MATLLGMIARPGQPKSTPAVIAMATIAASQLKLVFRVLRYLGGVLSMHQGPCVQRLRSPSPLARCSGLGDHDHSNPVRRPPATRPRATDSQEQDRVDCCSVHGGWTDFRGGS